MSRARRRTITGALLVAAVAAAGWVWLDRVLDEPYRGWPGAHVDVTVEPGMAARAVARRLREAGVVRDERLLLGWLWWTGKTGGIHVGEYRFDRPRSVREVTDIVVGGRVLLHPLTVPEGATRWQVAAAIAAAGFDDEDPALRATMAIELVADLDPLADSLEGYLFPETYMAPRSAGARELVGAMVARFREIWTPLRRARADALGMSVRQVVTLASLIEAETPTGAERQLVSAVFHNRLERGMLLQTDPTVIYAKKLAGRHDRTIYRSDLERDSPYNTYLVAGLPVGPIGNPRAASIDAALQPAEVEYLYFVSRKDGTHAFSRTLAEHNRLVDEYRRSR